MPKKSHLHSSHTCLPLSNLVLLLTISLTHSGPLDTAPTQHPGTQAQDAPNWQLGGQNTMLSTKKTPTYRGVCCTSGTLKNGTRTTLDPYHRNHNNTSIPKQPLGNPPGHPQVGGNWATKRDHVMWMGDSSNLTPESQETMLLDGRLF